MVLRPAVQEVLRARLATEAMAGADQELESYLGGQIGAELDEPEQPEEDWDLHGTWRRTRLRCMVYSSLGDLEEDDEDEYPEYENPNYDPISATVARVVSPPVAIWLTAILEFIGEQCLHVAGHATITRYSATRGVASSNIDGNGQNAHMPSVEELDAERVALNPSLGRLWRQWRKRTRGPGSISLSARESSSILSRLERQSSVNSMRMSLYGSISNESLRESLSPQPRSISDMPVTKEDEEESAFEAVEPESAPKVLIKDIETRKADEAHAEPNARKVEVETPVCNSSRTVLAMLTSAAVLSQAQQEASPQHVVDGHIRGDLPGIQATPCNVAAASTKIRVSGPCRGGGVLRMRGAGCDRE